MEHGYDIRLMAAGCRAASDAEHEAGIKLVKEKCGEFVEVVGES